MPKFDRKPPRQNGDNHPARFEAIPGVVEPRCHVCKSEYRKAIDQLIARGSGYTEVGRIFGIDRRSIKNHADSHLGWEEAAIRRIIDAEAEAANVNVEEGIQGALTRRVYLNVALQKALEGLLTGDTAVEVKDAVAVIQMLDKLDNQTEGAALDELRVQFNAFVQSIREIAPPEMWQAILDRTRELLENTIDAPAIQPPDDNR